MDKEIKEDMLDISKEESNSAASLFYDLIRLSLVDDKTSIKEQAMRMYRELESIRDDISEVSKAYWEAYKRIDNYVRVVHKEFIRGYEE
jgi:hypothetical protein